MELRLKTGPVTPALGLGIRQMVGFSRGRESWNGRMGSGNKKMMPRRFLLPVVGCRENVFHSSLTIFSGTLLHYI